MENFHQYLEEKKSSHFNLTRGRSSGRIIFIRETFKECYGLYINIFIYNHLYDLRVNFTLNKQDLASYSKQRAISTHDVPPTTAETVSLEPTSRA